jgi:hypothetical protein
MLLAAVTATSACEKNAVLDLDREDMQGGNVKFFNFSVGSPSVNFYVNDAKVTAVSATGCAILDDTNRQECLSTGREATTGVAYGGAGNGGSGWYSDVPTGAVTISGRISATVDKNLPISNLATTVETGRFYSYYLSGAYDAVAKQSDSFIVEDVLPTQDFAVAHVRFVNASANSEPMTLYLTNTTTNEVTPVGDLVAYKGASTWVAIPEGVNHTLATRTAGGTTVFTRAALAFSAGRAYTITARGTVGTASTMALDNTANR